MIEGLQAQGEPAQNGKVFYHPAVLTVEYISQYPDGGVTFKEISDYWTLPQNWSKSKDQRVEGTNLSDNVLHPGDVATFSLNLNPNKNGGFYHNIGAIAPAGGESPIAAQAQQSAPQSGGSWASEPAATGKPVIDKWDLKDIHIRKAQALNLLTEVLTSGDKVNAPKIVLAMGFADVDEAIDTVASGWNWLRSGLPIEFPVTVTDTEEEVTDLAEDNLEEDVESVSWD